MTALGAPQSTKAVYETLGATIAEAVEAPGFTWRLGQFGRTIQFVLSDPSATITASCPEGEKPSVQLGQTGLTPNLIARMSTQTAHELFLGELNIFLAMDLGKIAFSGDPRPFLALMPQLRSFVGPIYQLYFVDPDLPRFDVPAEYFIHPPDRSEAA